MKYCPEIIQEICKYIRAGNNYEDSAGLAGISRRTLQRWKKTHVPFVTALKKAEQECKARNIAIIQKAAEKSWQAAAWFLERKYHNEFALKSIREHTGESGQPITIKIIGDYVTKRSGNVSSPKASSKN